VFIRNHLKFSQVLLPQTYEHLEILCMDVFCNNFKQRYVCVYRPPSRDVDYITQLVSCLNILCNVDYSFIVCGDFNLPNIDWSQAINPQLLPILDSIFASFVIDNGLLQLIDQPTRANNVLDLLLVNDQLAVFNVSVLPPFSTSDHTPITWHSWFPSSVNESNAPVQYNFRRANFDALTVFFQSINWLQLFTCLPPDNVEGLWLLFKDAIYAGINLYVPLRSSIHRTGRRQYPTHIARALKLKRHFWRTRHRRNGLARYSAQTRVCSRLIRKFHTGQERKLLSSGSIRDFYKHVNSKLCASQRIAPVCNNGVLLTDDGDKAKAFNEYFASVFTCPSAPSVSPNAADAATSPSVTFPEHIVYKAMTQAKRSYSVGPDGIPSVFWASLASVLALPVSVLFYASYHFAIVPNEWKRAHVTPLYKKGNAGSVTNYRPISLTCTLGKIMEAIIRDNMMAYCLSHNIIDRNQHGFIRNKSTCSQMLECLHEWCSGLDVGGFFDVVYIDFRKAFDVVPHDLLVTKLANSGICERTLHWIVSFLSNRTQRVIINNVLSSDVPVTSGVIQGSV
jgi:hypothetical protein